MQWHAVDLIVRCYVVLTFVVPVKKEHSVPFIRILVMLYWRGGKINQLLIGLPNLSVMPTPKIIKLDDAASVKARNVVDPFLRCIVVVVLVV